MELFGVVHVGLARAEFAGGAYRSDWFLIDTYLEIFFPNLGIFFSIHVSTMGQWLEPHKLLKC